MTDKLNDKQLLAIELALEGLTDSQIARRMGEVKLSNSLINTVENCVTKELLYIEIESYKKRCTEYGEIFKLIVHLNILR